MTDTLTATVDTSAIRRISTDLWGIFFEDISSSADGGLASELVQNGAFEYSRADHDTCDRHQLGRSQIVRKEHIDQYEVGEQVVDHVSPERAEREEPQIAFCLLFRNACL